MKKLFLAITWTISACVCSSCCHYCPADTQSGTTAASQGIPTKERASKLRREDFLNIATSVVEAHGFRLESNTIMKVSYDKVDSTGLVSVAFHQPKKQHASEILTVEIDTYGQMKSITIEDSLELPQTQTRIKKPE